MSADNTTLAQRMLALAQQAKQAATLLGKASAEEKKKALLATAAALRDQQSAILDANRTDLDNGRRNGLDAARLERLTLNPQRLEAMATSFCDIAAMADPIGEIIQLGRRPSGIKLAQMRVPLGVVVMIYEGRPNVTADAAAICLQSGNAVILRGSSSAQSSNRAIAAAIADGLATTTLPAAAVQLVADPEHEAVSHLIALSAWVDMVIPRGGRSLIERVVADARVPVLKHYEGICHLYIDDEADKAMAIALADNSKTQRFGVCNALETLLVARSIAAKVLPELAQQLAKNAVEIRGDTETCALLPDAKQATEQDWHSEYLAPILSIRIVDDIDAAISHINHYGSAHTDAIVSNNVQRQQQFLREVDSSSVIVNASTRFADGAEYGLGAEIGISTDKFHARGPVGIKGLTCLKYIVHGEGQKR